MIKKFGYFIINNRFLINLIPQRFRLFLRRHWSFLEYDKYMWERTDPYKDVELISTYKSKVPYKIGIIKDYAHYHHNYIAACREMGVPYQIIDISKNNWIKEIKNCGCDAFLVWPSIHLTVWKQMFDERLKIMVDDLGKIIFPSYKELWLYENKRRVRDWLTAHNVPHPNTWIFYNIDEAMDFIRGANFPIVRKTAQGGAASGVKILHSLKETEKEVKIAFKKGIVPNRFNPRDRQWGYIILQEYIPHEYEWRVARIGDSFVYRKKIKVGNFASGSGVLIYEKPPFKLLDLVYNITKKGKFKSVGIDIFDTKNKGFLVNEIQALFGARKIPINKDTGRFIYDDYAKNWIFEEGNFYKNACAKLRIEYLLKILSGKNK